MNGCPRQNPAYRPTLPFLPFKTPRYRDRAAGCENRSLPCSMLRSVPRNGPSFDRISNGISRSRIGASPPKPERLVVIWKNIERGPFFFPYGTMRGHAAVPAEPFKFSRFNDHLRIHFRASAIDRCIVNPFVTPGAAVGRASNDKIPRSEIDALLMGGSKG
jgi:hypothetical protein